MLLLWQPQLALLTSSCSSNFISLSLTNSTCFANFNFLCQSKRALPASTCSANFNFLCQLQVALKAPTFSANFNLFCQLQLSLPTPTCFANFNFLCQLQLALLPWRGLLCQRQIGQQWLNQKQQARIKSHGSLLATYLWTKDLELVWGTFSTSKIVNPSRTPPSFSGRPTWNST